MQHALRYLRPDPIAATTHARRATERLLSGLIPGGKRTNLARLLKQLEEQFPETVRAHAETIRRLGNEAAHGTLDPEDAEVAIGSAVRIGEWVAGMKATDKQ